MSEVKTRSGAKVRIFDQHSGGDYPILGAYFNGEEWIPTKWDEHGRFPGVQEIARNNLDLIGYVKVEPS